MKEHTPVERKVKIFKKNTFYVHDIVTFFPLFWLLLVFYFFQTLYTSIGIQLKLKSHNKFTSPHKYMYVYF